MDKINFHYCDSDETKMPDNSGLVLVIRTDAAFSTRSIKAYLENIGHDHSILDCFNCNAGLTSNQIIHEAYKNWGHKVLESLSNNIDYSKYNITEEAEQKINVHFYDSHKLEDAVKQRAYDQYGDDVLLVSLDDMINGDESIAFSRLFSECGTTQYDYIARPGNIKIEEQMNHLVDIASQMLIENGKKPQMVFLEDNVRKASMLNWLVNKLEDYGVFEYISPIAISSCFCSADKDELTKIQYEGKALPVDAIVNYSGISVDVTTPRDLLFDGLVINIDDEIGRLPAVFMDLEATFKIDKDKTGIFRSEIAKINHDFCDELEQNLGIDLPLDAFTVGKPISQVTGMDNNETMKYIMNNI